MKQIEATEKLHYTACGLDYVYLVDGFDLYEDEDGDISYAIKDVDELHRSIAYTVITKCPELRGMELRFLRSFLHMSQTNMAKCLRKKRDSIAKYEAAPDGKLPLQVMDWLRTIVIGRIAEDAKVCELLDLIHELESLEEKELFFGKDQDEWQSIAA